MQEYLQRKELKHQMNIGDLQQLSYKFSSYEIAAYTWILRVISPLSPSSSGFGNSSYILNNLLKFA